MFFLNELQGKNFCECLNVSGNQLQTVFPAVLHLLVFFCKLREVFLGALLLSRNPSIHHQRGKQSCKGKRAALSRDIGSEGVSYPQ